MSEKELLETAKHYVQMRTGLTATGAKPSSRHGDRTFAMTVTVTAGERTFDIYMDWARNEIRLTEVCSTDSFFDYHHRSANHNPRKPWAMRMRNGRIKYFDTHDEMLAHSSRPEVSWKSMGCTNAVVKR